MTEEIEAYHCFGGPLNDMWASFEFVQRHHPNDYVFYNGGMQAQRLRLDNAVLIYVPCVERNFSHSR